MTCGTRASYVKGCRCDACRAANTRYATMRELHPPQLVDSQPIKEHLAQLRAAGVGKRTIARQSGVSQTVINRLIGIDGSKPARRVRAATAHKLLAVRADQLADGAYIDATGTTRRLQALVAIGHSQTALARRIGWTVANLNVIVLGNRDYVTVDTARLVAALYDELSMTPGTSARARTVAGKHGWLPPLAWDDDDIDNPEHDARQHIRTSDRVQLTAEDIDELVAHGETYDGIAARFGIKRNTVEQIVNRARREAS